LECCDHGVSMHHAYALFVGSVTIDEG